MDDKSKLKVTKGGRRPGPVRRQTPHHITPGRLRLISGILILTFLISSIPLASAGGSRDDFSFVLVKELKGEVVDNETRIYYRKASGPS